MRLPLVTSCTHDLNYVCYGGRNMKARHITHPRRSSRVRPSVPTQRATAAMASFEIVRLSAARAAQAHMRRRRREKRSVL